MRQVRRGVWELRVSTGRANRFTGRYGEVSRTFHGTKSEAAAELAALGVDVWAGRHRHPGATVDQLFDAYLGWFAAEAAAGHRSPGSFYKSYEPKIRLHLRPHLGTYQVSALADGQLINELYEAMLDDRWAGRPITPTMVFEVHRILSAVLGWAVAHDWITAADDPRRYLKAPAAPRGDPLALT